MTITEIPKTHRYSFVPVIANDGDSTSNITSLAASEFSGRHARLVDGVKPTEDYKLVNYRGRVKPVQIFQRTVTNKAGKTTTTRYVHLTNLRKTPPMVFEQ